MRRNRKGPALFELIGKGAPGAAGPQVPSGTGAPAAPPPTPAAPVPAAPVHHPQNSPAPPTYSPASPPMMQPAQTYAAPVPASVSGNPSAGIGIVPSPVGYQDEEDRGFTWQLRRTIRLPMGYLFLGVAGLILVAIAAYVLGYSAAERSLAGGDRGESLVPLEDPLQQPGGGASDSGARDGAGATPPSAGSGRVVVVDGNTRDPRTKGLNYLIVARYPPGEARQAADFLAERDIAVAIVPADRAQFRLVVALSGFPRPDTAFETRVKAIGREFKSRGGPTDFSTAYFARYE